LKPKVLLVCPHGRYILSFWHNHYLSNILQLLPEGSQVKDRTTGHLDAMNGALYEALEMPRNSWDWMWVVEDDVIPGTNALEHLEDYPPGSIVGHLAYNRDVNRQTPHAGWIGKNLQVYWLNDEELDRARGGAGLYQVDMVSLCSTLIHREVFETWVADPDALHHQAHLDHLGEWHDIICKHHWPPFQTPPGPDLWQAMSADLWFCWHAGDLGVPIYLDPRVECAHIGEIPITHASHLRYRVYRDELRQKVYGMVPWDQIFKEGS
jgi:hypothetical protein